MNSQLKKTYILDVFFFASTVYWTDLKELNRVYSKLQNILSSMNSLAGETKLRFRLLTSEDEVKRMSGDARSELAIFVPMSGGVQPWMLRLAGSIKFVALANLYLPDPAVPNDIANRLLYLNAHPACTDFYAYLQLRNQQVFWLSALSMIEKLNRAFQGYNRLKNAVVLKIGETESWVINSCRDPARFREKLGTKILPIDRQELYAGMETVSDSEVQGFLHQWLDRGRSAPDISRQDLMDAGRVTAGLMKLLDQYEADGLSIACFTLIRDINTTSCLALSYLNSSSGFVGACEGDLDAAVTMFLMKSLGAEYVWMANPVIYKDNFVDMVHCTAPFRTTRGHLPHQLMRHHESGKGVSLKVQIPLETEVTLTRIGNDLNEMAVTKGKTSAYPDLSSCRTQVRINLPSTVNFLKKLLGTHQVVCPGDFTEELSYCAVLFGLSMKGDPE